MTIQRFFTRAFAVLWLAFLIGWIGTVGWFGFAQTFLQQNYDPRAYQFTRTSGSGVTADLSTAGAKTAVLTPCPKAITSASVNLSTIRISGGTGTAETVTVTSYVAGSGSCTIGFTTSNTHTGSWQMTEGTAGIQGALLSGTRPHVVVPPGDYNVYGTITPPTGATLEGSGALWAQTGAPTRLVFYSTNTPLIHLVNNNVTVRALTLVGNGGGTAVSGSYGIKTECCGGAPYVGPPFAPQYLIEDVAIWYFYVGYRGEGSSEGVLQKVRAYFSESNAYETLGVQGPWDNVEALNNKGDALNFGHGTDAGDATPFLRGIYTYDNQGYAIRSVVRFDLRQFFFNFDKAGEIYLNVYGSLPVTISDGRVEVAGGSITYGNKDDAVGIEVAATSAPLHLANVSVNTSRGRGIVFANGGNRIRGSHVISNGTAATPAGDAYGIEDTAGQNNYVDNVFGGAFKFGGGSSTFVGNAFAGSSEALPLIQFACASSCPGVIAFNESNTVNKSAGTADAVQADAGTIFAPPFNPRIQAGTRTMNGTITGELTPGTIAFTDLSAAKGTLYICTNCVVTGAGDNTCASGVGNALAVKLGAAWRCFALQN